MSGGRVNFQLSLLHESEKVCRDLGRTYASEAQKIRTIETDQFHEPAIRERTLAVLRSASLAAQRAADTVNDQGPALARRATLAARADGSGLATFWGGVAWNAVPKNVPRVMALMKTITDGVKDAHREMNLYAMQQLVRQQSYTAAERNLAKILARSNRGITKVEGLASKLPRPSSIHVPRIPGGRLIGKIPVLDIVADGYEISTAEDPEWEAKKVAASHASQWGTGLAVGATCEAATGIETLGLSTPVCGLAGLGAGLIAAVGVPAWMEQKHKDAEKPPPKLKPVISQSVANDLKHIEVPLNHSAAHSTHHTRHTP